jgi:hypothetical protein
MICHLCQGEEEVCGQCECIESDCQCEEYEPMECPECEGAGEHE